MLSIYVLKRTTRVLALLCLNVARHGEIIGLIAQVILLNEYVKGKVQKPRVK